VRGQALAVQLAIQPGERCLEGTPSTSIQAFIDGGECVADGRASWATSAGARGSYERLLRSEERSGGSVRAVGVCFKSMTAQGGQPRLTLTRIIPENGVNIGGREPSGRDTEGPPKPPRSETARPSRAAPRHRGATWGLEGPPAPPCSDTPGVAGARLDLPCGLGEPTGPDH
jgi:hypothetical protein